MFDLEEFKGRGRRSQEALMYYEEAVEGLKSGNREGSSMDAYIRYLRARDNWMSTRKDREQWSQVGRFHKLPPYKS